MGYVQSRHRPLVLSRFDLPHGADLLVASCEDCACAISGDLGVGELPAEPTDAADDTREWVCGSEVSQLRLDPDHTLLFNPLGSGGVVVVDEAALAIFLRFAVPAAPAQVRRESPGAGFGRTFRRLADLELVHRADRRQAPRFQPSQTLTAWLHVTNGCNLRCPYCYVNKSSEAMTEPVGRAAVEAVVSSALRAGLSAVKLKYAGGEASLNHRLVVKLHAYARELTGQHGLQLYATLLSNGVRLPSSLVSVCKAEGIGVMISLDGVGEQHDAQRPFPTGKPSFELVDRTIADLIHMGHPPHLSVTITSRNAPGVADVVRYALDRDLTFSLNLFRDNDCAASFTDLQYEEQAVVESLRAAFGVIEANLPRWSVLGSVLDRGQLLQPRQRSCGVGQDYVVIDQRGQVAKCHMELEQTLGDVFASDPLKLVRDDRTTTLNLAVDEKAGCRDCTWRYWCSGGCSVATFRATGRYDIKSPNCNIYKAIYPEALRLEGLRLLKYASV